MSIFFTQAKFDEVHFQLTHLQSLLMLLQEAFLKLGTFRIRTTAMSLLHSIAPLLYKEETSDQSKASSQMLKDVQPGERLQKMCTSLLTKLAAVFRPSPESVYPASVSHVQSSGKK